MRIFVIITCGIFTILILSIIVIKGVSWDSIGGLILLGGGGIFFVFEKNVVNWIDKRRKKKIEDSNCIIEDDYFYFPKGYYFKYGFLKDQKKLPFINVNEIRTNTFPISAKINGNEIVFLRGLKKTDLDNFMSKTDIPLVKPQDNWALICEEFLDTEFEEERKEITLILLEQSGIERIESRQIRKRLKIRMLLRTVAFWEWIYYGQYDVLIELWPLNEKKYWWTMDIALRNKNS